MRCNADLFGKMVQGSTETAPNSNWTCHKSAGWLLPLATGMRQGFRGVHAALAERHSHAGECASCKEGGDEGDACNDTPILTFPHNCGGRNQPTTPLPCFSIPPFNLRVNNLIIANESDVSRGTQHVERHSAGHFSLKVPESRARYRVLSLLRMIGATTAPACCQTAFCATSRMNFA